MGRTIVDCLECVCKDVLSCGCAPVGADVFEAGECLALRGRGEAVDELREERETLVAGTGDVPGSKSFIL